MYVCVSTKKIGSEVPVLVSFLFVPPLTHTPRLQTDRAGREKHGSGRVGKSFAALHTHTHTHIYIQRDDRRSNLFLDIRYVLLERFFNLGSKVYVLFGKLRSELVKQSHHIMENLNLTGGVHLAKIIIILG